MGPAETVVYLRGTFNNWDLSVPMEYSQQYGYLATLDLPAGNHEFKFADESWQKLDLGFVGTPIKFGEQTPLGPQGGNLRVILDNPTNLIFALVIAPDKSASLRVISGDTPERADSAAADGR